jgi:hypothetical protein
LQYQALQLKVTAAAYLQMYASLLHTHEALQLPTDALYFTDTDSCILNALLQIFLAALLYDWMAPEIKACMVQIW